MKSGKSLHLYAETAKDKEDWVNEITSIIYEKMILSRMDQKYWPENFPAPESQPSLL
jgi:hypothetical protein